MDYIKAIYYKLMQSNNPRALKRFNHSVGVAFKAIEIIRDNHLDVDEEKAYIAGLLHDYAKFTTIEEYMRIVSEYNYPREVLNLNEKVLHGILGYRVVFEELGITDKEILGAIENHVFGKENMSPLEEVIYLADYIENNRIGEEYEFVRKIAKTDYKKAIAYECDFVLKHLISTDKNVHSNAFLMYNQYKKYLN